MNPTISICNIVKNEEKQIGDFLQSLVDFADEIIIVDTGSSDKTVGIVKDFCLHSNKIKFFRYESEGVFHYGKAKNFSIGKATSNFIIVLDTDERLSDEFKKKIKNFLGQYNPDVSKIKRVDDLVPHLVDRPERIIKNRGDVFYHEDERGRVHENLSHNFKPVFFEEIVWHKQGWNHYINRPHRILVQLELQIERTPKTKSFLGHFLRGIWYAQFRFRKLYFGKQLYKDGRNGFKYAFMRAWDAFLIEFFVGLKQT